MWECILEKEQVGVSECVREYERDSARACARESETVPLGEWFQLGGPFFWRFTTAIKVALHTGVKRSKIETGP